MAVTYVEKAWSEANQLRDPKGRFAGSIGAGNPGGGGGAAGGGLAELTASEKEGVAEIQAFLKVTGGYPPPRPYKYTTDSLIAEKGQPFAMFEGTYEGKRGTPHHCFENASKHAMQYGKRDGLTYVEGYVNVAGVPIHHAWTVNQRGQVIDPTLRDSSMIRGYFGVPFKADYVHNTALRTRYWGIISGETNREMFRQGPPPNAYAKVGE